MRRVMAPGDFGTLDPLPGAHLGPGTWLMEPGPGTLLMELGPGTWIMEPGPGGAHVLSRCSGGASQGQPVARLEREVVTLEGVPCQRLNSV